MRKNEFFFFFLISNKEVYSENYLKKTEAEQTIQREKQTEKEKRTRKQAENNKELNTKERIKEQREGITSSESPSPRPIK